MTDDAGAASTLSIREKGAGQVFSVQCEVPAQPIFLAITAFSGLSWDPLVVMHLTEYETGADVDLADDYSDFGFFEPAAKVQGTKLFTLGASRRCFLSHSDFRSTRFSFRLL